MTFDDGELTWSKRGDRRRLASDIQLIFQDPYSSLNPRHTIVGSPFRYQKVKPRDGIRAAVQGLLEQVGLSPEHYNRYPNEFSSGSGSGSASPGPSR